jgi:uncharacterized Zn finger protein (UPF0148 family)
MAEKPRLCMLCGLQEVETGSICPACQEGVKREALGKQANLKQQAEREMRRHGVNPERAQRSDAADERQSSEP